MTSRRGRCCFVAALAAVAATVVACSSGDGSPGESGGVGSVDDAAAGASVADSTVTLSSEQRSIVSDVQTAIDGLLESPAVDVTYVGENVDGGTVTGSVQIETATGNFTSREELSSELNPDVRVVSELILVDDEIHARITGASEEPDEASWSRSEPGSLREEFVDEAYTAQGAAGASLARIVRLLREVPWVPGGTAETEVDGVPVRSHFVRFEAGDIYRYFRTEGLELVGPVIPDGITVFEFWIDDGDDVLVRLLAAGVQFQDGEPLPDAEIAITYERLDEFEAIAPQATRS